MTKRPGMGGGGGRRALQQLAEARQRAPQVAEVLVATAPGRSASPTRQNVLWSS